LSSNIIPKDAALLARRWEPQRIEANAAGYVGLIPAMQDRPELVAHEATPTDLAAEELRQLRETARREGFEQGLAEGRAQGARDAAELKILVASLREVAQALEQSLAERIVELAVEVARCVVRRAIAVHPEFMVEVVKEAVASLPEIEAQTEIALHPADAQLLREVLRTDANAALPWHVVEDATVSRGGCNVATRASNIDATLESRWRRIVAGLGRDDRWLPASHSAHEANSRADD
jgi:flagellar assembly protein FliH